MVWRCHMAGHGNYWCRHTLCAYTELSNGSLAWYDYVMALDCPAPMLVLVTNLDLPEVVELS